MNIIKVEPHWKLCNIPKYARLDVMQTGIYKEVYHGHKGIRSTDC